MTLKATHLFTTRGCPFRCTFCAGSLVFGRKIRFHSVDRVIREARQLVEQYGVEGLYFADDFFLANRIRARRICEAIIHAGLAKQVVWAAQLRADVVDEETLELLKQAGCRQVEFGFESGSDKILRRMEKKATVADNRQAAKLVKKSGIRLLANIIVGYPGETEKDLQATHDFVREICPDSVGYNRLVVLPGSKLYQELEESNRLVSRDWSRYHVGGMDPGVKPLNYTALDNDRFFSMYSTFFEGYVSQLDAYNLIETLSYTLEKHRGYDLSHTRLKWVPVSRNSANPDKLQKALNHLESWELREGIDQLEHYVSQYPNDLVGLLNVAVSLVLMMELDKATSILSRAFKLHLSPAVLIVYAQACIRFGNLEGAKEALGRALALPAPPPEARILLGNCYVLEGNLRTACQHYSAALPHPVASKNLACALQELARELDQAPIHDTLSMPFDRYQRFRAVADLIRGLQQKSLTILDVGGDDGALGRFLHGHHYTCVDLIQGVDGSALPYPDRAFDVVVSIDVLEHVPPARRQRFISEMIRVARRRIYLATPLATSAEAEQLVYRLTGNAWLKEHLEHGLPTAAEIETILSQASLSYTKRPNGSLASWVPMILLNHVMKGEELEKVNRFFNQRYSADEDREPAYRYIYEIDLSETKPAVLPERGPRELITSKKESTKYQASIVIPVYNQVDLTRQCLEALVENTTDVEYEVVIVDNGSTDSTPQLLAALEGDVKVLRNSENRGFVEACNQGAEVAEGKYLVFLNNDTLPRAGWLREMVNLAEEDPSVGAVGAKLIYPDGRLQEAGAIIWSDGTGWNYGRGDDPQQPQYNKVREVDYCSGACLLVRRDLFQHLGGFDTRYSPAYYEDTDLCFSLRRLGFRVLYQPRAEVIHYEGGTAGTDLKRGLKSYQVVNHARFSRKWATELLHQFPPSVELVAQAASRQRQLNILMADHTLPMYDRASGCLRLYQLIRLLREEGHRITYLALYGLGDQERYRQELEQMGVEVQVNDRHYLARLGYQVEGPTIDLEALVGGRWFDVAILSTYQVAEQYLPVIRTVSPSTKIILDTVDVHFLREQRKAQLSDDPFAGQGADEVKRRELDMCIKADLVITVTMDDRLALLAEGVATPIEIIPNIHDGGSTPAPFEPRHDLLFVGNFNHPPNADAVYYFLQEIWPLVKEHLPGVKLVIAGNKSDKVITTTDPLVTITGYVPDLQPLLQSCRVSIAPLRYGAGMKGKVGEAMAAGLPVVSTPVGVEGMGLTPGKNVLVADHPVDFARAICDLYTNPYLWSTLAENARAYILETFGPKAIRPKLQEILKRYCMSTTGLPA